MTCGVQNLAGVETQNAQAARMPPLGTHQRRNEADQCAAEDEGSPEHCGFSKAFAERQQIDLNREEQTPHDRTPIVPRYAARDYLLALIQWVLSVFRQTATLTSVITQNIGSIKLHYGVFNDSVCARALYRADGSRRAIRHYLLFG